MAAEYCTASPFISRRMGGRGRTGTLSRPALPYAMQGADRDPVSPGTASAIPSTHPGQFMIDLMPHLQALWIYP